MTNDKKQPGLAVVEVDQAFPLMTTDGVSRSATSTGITGDQGPSVSAAIRDVLGWRPRVQDPKAFTAALAASFDLSIFEDHVIAKYIPRGVAVQADLGAVTGGQASLYLRAKASHEQITRMLESLKPLRTDADPQDCEAYRGLVRDSVRRIVAELGREGGPRVPLVDSAFSVLTGYQPVVSVPTPLMQPPSKNGQSSGTPPDGDNGELSGMRRSRRQNDQTSGTPPQLPNWFTPGTAPGRRSRLTTLTASPPSVGFSGENPGYVPAAIPDIDPDTVPGQLGALRDRFGLDDDHVNTVDEEKQRTSFWTLVELITDLQRSWDIRRLDFTLGAGNGFLGTDLVQISRLLAAASEQVDEFEAVLDSVLVSGAERQTVVLDRATGLTLDDLVQWLRVFVTEDGPNIIRDTGRDGLVSSFTPTAAALLLTLRDKLVRRLVPCCGPSCAGGCHCGSRGQVTCIPLGCCTPLPPGLYAGRVKIAVSTLCGLVERLTARAIRIGRFAGAVLLDLAVVPFENGTDFVRVDVRGLHLRPTYVPAFISDDVDPADPAALVLPLQGSASADADSLSGIFQKSALPEPLLTLLNTAGNRGVLMAASDVPLAVLDGELGRVVQGPAVTTWPRLRPADIVADDDGPDDWDDIPPNQRFVPQSPFDPVDTEVEEDECLEECGDDCEGCDCGCHTLGTVRKKYHRIRNIMDDGSVKAAAKDVVDDLPVGIRPAILSLLRFVRSNDLGRLVDAVADAACDDTEVQAAAEAQTAAQTQQAAEAPATWAEDLGRQEQVAEAPATWAEDLGRQEQVAEAPATWTEDFGRQEQAAEAQAAVEANLKAASDAQAAAEARAQELEADVKSLREELDAARQADIVKRLREAWTERRTDRPDMDSEAFARTKDAEEIVAEVLSRGEEH